ncbi:Scr1 family TA system antitoxin-like transcriptional regulator [Streptodolium elevatio]
MRAQFAHLVDLTDLTETTGLQIRIVPFTSGSQGVGAVETTLFGFPGEAHASTAATEVFGATVLTEAPRSVRFVRKSFERLDKVALSPVDSMNLIRSRSQELRNA